MPRRDIYVEIRIRGDLDELWEKTQVPEIHERWDLRFTGIEYLPRPSEEEPQRFLYTTRIGFGLEIAGEGETVGSRSTASGQRASALKFWSDDPKSLIREGSGYWKYIPTTNGLRFLTGYDYKVRWGALGRLVDRSVFRPLMGWGTAWSFDRLRLWIEEGLDPAAARRQFLAFHLARLGVAGVWIWHGLVPKILLRHPDELALLADGGVPEELRTPALLALGAAEILFGSLVAAAPHRTGPLAATVVLMVVTLAAVALTSPTYLGGAFNPVTLNLTTALLAGIGWLLGRGDLPSARRCLRRPPTSTTETSETAP